MPKKMSPSALRRAIPAWNLDTWEEAEAAALASPADADVLARLEAALRRDGRFAEPVVIDPETLELRDGTHRALAAIRTGVAIDVAWSYPEGCPDSDLREVWFRAEVIDPDLTRAWADEDEEDLEMLGHFAAVNALRSIEIDGGWLNADVFGHHRDDGSVTTFIPAMGVAMPDDDELVGILVIRAREAGLRLTVETIDHDPPRFHDTY